MPGKYPTDPALREALQQHRTDYGLTNAKFAKILGVGATFISKYIGDKLDHNPADFEPRAWDALKSLAARIELSNELFDTSVTRAIHGRIQFILETADFGIFVSEPGIGKTSAALLWQQRNPSSLYVCLNDRTRDGGKVEGEIFKAVENRSWNAHSPRREFLVNRLADSQRVILIDNAQRLSISGLAWLLDFRDDTDCPIVLFGNPGILDKAKTDGALHSRIGICPPPLLLDPKEVSRIATRVCTNFSDQDSADTISDLTAYVAQKSGHLRAVRKQTILAKKLMELQPDKIKNFETAFRMAHRELVRDYQLPA